jgi:ABC-type Mn2+/Zn2+ transport system ATPase subunit
MAEAAVAQRLAPSGTTVLDVKGLQAWYNESHILHGVDLDVRQGEVVTLLGRNGAGKTTTLKAIMGIVRKRVGSVVFDGKELIGLTALRGTASLSALRNARYSLPFRSRRICFCRLRSPRPGA